VERTVLLGLLMALGAFGVDTILPGLEAIAWEYGVPQTRAQLVVGTYFFGFAFGQLVFGPVSDSVGRRRVLLGALGSFATLGFVLPFAGSFPWLVALRLVQGFFGAGMRSVCTAVLRDRAEGAGMARAMAFVQMVFLVAPVIAPSVGALLLRWGWRAVFTFLGSLALGLWVWAWGRLEETLPLERRRPFGLGPLRDAAALLFRTREPLAATLVLGFSYGMLYGYLVGSAQLYKTHLGLSNTAFALAFGATGVVQSLSLGLTGLLVVRLGLRRFLLMALVLLALLGGSFPLHAAVDRTPITLWAHVSLVIFGVGLVFPNAVSLALAPLGRVAGFAASVVGFVSSLMASILGNLTGQWSGGEPVRFGMSWLLLSSLALTAGLPVLLPARGRRPGDILEPGS